MINNVQPLNIEFQKGYLWDTLCIDWEEVMITYNGNEIMMPRWLFVPMIDKLRTRGIMKNHYETTIMLKQGRNWLNLKGNQITSEPQVINDTK